MKHVFPQLPEGYREIDTVDLQKNTRLAIGINLGNLLIAAVMVVVMLFFHPIGALFDTEKGLTGMLVRALSLIAAMLAYLVLHEASHAVAMKCFGTKKVRFGFTGLYAYAGSDDYYDRASHRIIALTPVVVWGIVLLILNFLVPEEWFWVVYLVQVVNVSGAIGDLYVTFRFLRYPRDILIRDIGVVMMIYSRSAPAPETPQTP